MRRSYFAGASLVALLNGCGIDTLPGHSKSDVPRPQPETTRDVSTLIAKRKSSASWTGKQRALLLSRGKAQARGKFKKPLSVLHLLGRKLIFNLAKRKPPNPQALRARNLSACSANIFRKC
jgi:hypothetical protein